jgi:hypothetical protein
LSHTPPPPPLPHYEVIITTKILQQERLLSQQADIFYVNDGDWWHYERPKAVKPTPECDYARVRAECPLYQYRTDVYRARCQDGSGLEVSLGALTVFPPPADRPRPWQAEQCTITAAMATR